MPTETILTDEFLARSEDGREFQIFHYTDYIISERTFNGEPARTEGWKHLETSDGMSVSPLENDRYRIDYLQLVVQRVRD